MMRYVKGLLIVLTVLVIGCASNEEIRRQNKVKAQFSPVIGEGGEVVGEIYNK